MTGTRWLGGALMMPQHCEGVVFDVDGVLLDTLGADQGLCVQAANEIMGNGAWITSDMVRAHFALEPQSFWQKLCEHAPHLVSKDDIARLIARYETLRKTIVFKPLPGIVDILADCNARGVPIGVASSNAREDVEAMLGNAGLGEAGFRVISGLGAPGVRPKPQPDLYHAACEGLGLAPQRCLFVEDSPTGLASGRAADMGYAVAVATGPWSVAELENTGLADCVYDHFAPPRLALAPGAPAQKTLDTPNDFASHMIEHIAWRIGAGIDLSWRNTDWRTLGRMLGETIAREGFVRESAATLGMIDDGAAEVFIERDAPAGVDFSTHASLPRERVLAMRVEQVAKGADLIDLMEGLAHGLAAKITVRLCTFEDPHHSWEGVYRAIGICLARMRSAAP
jgi:HAD superfamily hydrolase (TIGR01509 family)